jgi:hypothetical protein
MTCRESRWNALWRRQTHGLRRRSETSSKPAANTANGGDLRGGTKPSPRGVEGLMLPLDLAAGEGLISTSRYASWGHDEAEAHFDLREVEVVPDRDAIWNAVLETAAQPQREEDRCEDRRRALSRSGATSEPDSRQPPAWGGRLSRWT